LRNQEANEKKLQENKLKARELKRKKIKSSLSFEMEDEAGGGDEEKTAALKAKKRLKDRTVDTSYLPDRERDKMLAGQKQKLQLHLQQNWMAHEDRIKNEVSRLCSDSCTRYS
jgi:protein FAM50